MPSKVGYVPRSELGYSLVKVATDNKIGTGYARDWTAAAKRADLAPEVASNIARAVITSTDAQREWPQWMANDMVMAALSGAHNARDAASIVKGVGDHVLSVFPRPVQYSAGGAYNAPLNTMVTALQSPLTPTQAARAVQGVIEQLGKGYNQAPTWERAWQQALSSSN